MKMSLRFAIPAVASAVSVSAAFWLLEAVVPQAVAVPFEASRLAMLLVVLVIGLAAARRGLLLEAASLFAGSGVGWALHEIHPLSLCQSDLLWPPCTPVEIGSIALPAVVLLVSAAALLVFRAARTRQAS